MNNLKRFDINNENISGELIFRNPLQYGKRLNTTIGKHLDIYSNYRYENEELYNEHIFISELEEDQYETIGVYKVRGVEDKYLVFNLITKGSSKDKAYYSMMLVKPGYLRRLCYHLNKENEDNDLLNNSESFTKKVRRMLIEDGHIIEY